MPIYERTYYHKIVHQNVAALHGNNQNSKKVFFNKIGDNRLLEHNGTRKFRQGKGNPLVDQASWIPNTFKAYNQGYIKQSWSVGGQLYKKLVVGFTCKSFYIM